MHPKDKDGFEIFEGDKLTMEIVGLGIGEVEVISKKNELFIRNT